MCYLSTNVTPSYLAAAVSQFLSILHTHGLFVNLQTVAVSAFKLYFCLPVVKILALLVPECLSSHCVLLF